MARRCSASARGRLLNPLYLVPKQFSQTFLRRIGLYHRLKASWVYDFYWSIARKEIIESRAKEVEFYRQLLVGFMRKDLILDIGANHGRETDVFLRLGARVVAVEPDDYNQFILRQKFLTYRLAKKPVVIVGKAVSDRQSVETMWIEKPGSAMNTLSKKWADSLRVDGKRFGHALDFAHKKEIETITLGDLINTYGVPVFVKIDVEGYEALALRGLKEPVPYLSFEVNLPDFKSEGFECIEWLHGLDAGGKFNYVVEFGRGLALKNWLNHHDFAKVFDSLQEASVDVFWKQSQSR
jgi:FkbM family methyltransferase